MNITIFLFYSMRLKTAKNSQMAAILFTFHFLPFFFSFLPMTNPLCNYWARNLWFYFFPGIVLRSAYRGKTKRLVRYVLLTHCVGYIFPHTYLLPGQLRTSVYWVFCSTYVMHHNISSVVEFQRWWVLKSKIFAMWWPGFKDFIWNGGARASEAHKNEFLNYEVLKI